MTFRDMHYGELPLLLPNAWDVPSALALLECGFTAVGTTSFGVASSLGRPDGGRSTKEANLALASALRPLDCYLSVDIEDGYADDPDKVADYVARLPGAVRHSQRCDDPAVADRVQLDAVAVLQRHLVDRFSLELGVGRGLGHGWPHQDRRDERDGHASNGVEHARHCKRLPCRALLTCIVPRVSTSPGLQFLALL